MSQVYLQNAEQKKISIPLGQATLGRHTGNEMVVDGQGISRQHARFAYQNSQLTVTDLESSNGTYINDQQLTPHKSYPLQNGDEVRFGRFNSFTIHGLESSPKKPQNEPPFQQTVMDDVLPQPSPPAPMAYPPPQPAGMAAYPQQPANQPDTNIAVVLEIIGVLGLMGIGWIYTGNTGTGILLLICWLLFIWGSYFFIFFGASIFTTITLGLGAFTYFCLCIIPIFQIVGPIVSALTLKARLEGRR